MNNALAPDRLPGAQSVSFDQEGLAAIAMQGFQCHQSGNASPKNDGVVIKESFSHECYGPATLCLRQAGIKAGYSARGLERGIS